MNFEYETNRLLIRILQEDSCDQILDFYYRNRSTFEPFEPNKPSNYYSKEYQQKLVASEYYSFLNLKYIRFFIVTKSNPDYIIGTISFSNIQNSPYHSCTLGYKFDFRNRKQGFASESMQKCLSIIFNELKLHKIEAFIMPNNCDSIRFINRQGFHCEGISYKCIEINGKWEDHLRYALIN